MQDWDWSLKFHLAHNVEWERCSFDRYVVRAGDPATHVYLIVSGQVSNRIPMLSLNVAHVLALSKASGLSGSGISIGSTLLVVGSISNEWQ